MAYKINVEEIERYIDYLKKLKKKLERDLSDFDRMLKDAHNHWNDETYTLTIEAKEKVSKEIKKLNDEISRLLKNLQIMHEKYTNYLRRRG